MTESHASPETAGVVAQDQERLARAEKAYVVGNFRVMRALCDSLVRSEDAEVAAKSRALRDKVAVDAQAIHALAFSFALACVIVVAYVL